MQPTAIVIGAGIVGLATARALAVKGYKVTVFERTSFAVGASVRNFGMLWPIGQTSGKLYDRAVRSRDIWEFIGESGAFWFDPVGSLHVAHHEDEWQVMQEVYEHYKEERPLQLLTPAQVAEKNASVILDGCKGGLFSADEVIVDPRQAIRNLPQWLKENFSVEFIWDTTVVGVRSGSIITGERKRYEADLIMVCSGADFETLYPEIFDALPLTRCKLQMMRFQAQPDNWRMGPALCGGLSLVHYKSFEVAESLPVLKRRYQSELPEYLQHGIHVMVSQNEEGALTIGDSHEYGSCPDPFDKVVINQLILEYLSKIARFPLEKVSETWNGVYPKFTNGDTEFHAEPDPGVHILNGVGGAGMTLSFGFAEEIINKIC